MAEYPRVFHHVGFFMGLFAFTANLSGPSSKGALYMGFVAWLAPTRNKSYHSEPELCQTHQ